MSDELIVRQCSPTLAGLKTGNMFSAEFESKAGTIETIRSLNLRLAPYGLCMIPLRFMEKRVLVYMYSPKRLSEDLERPQVRELLRGLGYDLSSAGGCIARLRRRMGDGGDFRMRWGFFSAIRPRTCGALLKTGRRAASALAAGRYTAM